jgi:predicted enzyme related to lactoylglutathione lyase
MKAIKISFIVSIVCTVVSYTVIAQVQQAPPAFNHMYLAVHNIDSSVQFYTKAFDLKVTDQFNQLNITQADSSFTRSVKIVFLKFPNQDFVFELGERADKNDTTRQGNLFQHIGIEVKDITSALQRAVNAGGKVYVPIRRVRTSSGLEIKQAFIRGPDGESVEFAEIVAKGY